MWEGDFMSMDAELAHDLRMPLQLIDSSARMLKLSLEDPSLDAVVYADILLDSVARLRRLAEAALADRTVERTFAPKSIDLEACVRMLCRDCRPYVAERGVELRFSSNVAPLNMWLDADMLARVLLNLISNALRFTPGGGEILVTLMALGEAVEITVADTGAGIPAARQPWVFLRGETDGGHGDGLPIARELARRMGGELTVRSAQGCGAAFTLRLPLRAAEEVPRPCPA